MANTPSRPGYLESWKQTIVICTVVVASNLGAALCRPPQVDTSSFGAPVVTPPQPALAAATERARLRLWPPPERWASDEYDHSWAYGIDDERFDAELRTIGREYGLDPGQVPSGRALLQTLIDERLLLRELPFRDLDAIEDVAGLESAEQNLLKGFVAGAVIDLAVYGPEWPRRLAEAEEVEASAPSPAADLLPPAPRVTDGGLVGGPVPTPTVVPPQSASQPGADTAHPSSAAGRIDRYLERRVREECEARKISPDPYLPRAGIRALALTAGTTTGPEWQALLAEYQRGLDALGVEVALPGP